MDTTKPNTIPDLPDKSDKTNFAGIPKSYQPPTPASTTEHSPNTAMFSALPVTPPITKGIPVAIFMFFVVASFMSGLILGSWYYQGKAIPKTETKNVVTAPPQTLIVGTDATNFPMEYGTKEGGVAGYDIDLAYRLANELGFTVEFKNLPHSALFPELNNKKIDMVISAVTIKDTLKEKYTFSEPYFNTGEVIVSQKETPIATTDELKDKKIAVQKNTKSEEEAHKYTKAEMISAFEDLADAAKAVEDGSADALIADRILIKDVIIDSPTLVTSDSFTENAYGIVLRKNQPELLKKINQALTKLKTQGTLPDLKEKWLNTP